MASFKDSKWNLILNSSENWYWNCNTVLKQAVALLGYSLKIKLFLWVLCQLWYETFVILAFKVSGHYPLPLLSRYVFLSFVQISTFPYVFFFCHERLYVWWCVLFLTYCRVYQASKTHWKVHLLPVGYTITHLLVSMYSLQCNILGILQQCWRICQLFDLPCWLMEM